MLSVIIYKTILYHRMSQTHIHEYMAYMLLSYKILCTLCSKFLYLFYCGCTLFEAAYQWSRVKTS